jgi:hypothetical protein
MVQELGNPYVIRNALEGLADLSVAQGQAERAARLFGAAERLHAAAGIRWEGHQSDYQRSVAAARTQLGEAAFAGAWEAGRALPLEEAIRVALAEDGIPTTGRQGS